MKPKVEPSRSDQTPQDFAKSPRCLEYTFFKKKRGRFQPRQRAGKNFMGGEDISPTTLSRAALAIKISNYAVHPSDETTSD